MSKSDHIIVGFDNIDVCEAKYLSSSLDGDILPLMAMGVPNVYGRFMDGMDKMCNGHPWCTTKTNNIHNNIRFSFRRSSSASHLQCPNTIVITNIVIGDGVLQLQRVDGMNSYFHFCWKCSPL